MASRKYFELRKRWLFVTISHVAKAIKVILMIHKFTYDIKKLQYFALQNSIHTKALVIKQVLLKRI